MAERIYQLEDSFGYLINQLAHRIQREFEADLAEHGVTVKQWGVLLALHEIEGMSAGELASRLNIDAAAITRLIDRLQKKKLVSRVKQSRDKRGVRLSLTDEALALMPRLIELSKERNRAFLGRLGESDREQLVRSIRKLARD